MHDNVTLPSFCTLTLTCECIERNKPMKSTPHCTGVKILNTILCAAALLRGKNTGVLPPFHQLRPNRVKHLYDIEERNCKERFLCSRLFEVLWNQIFMKNYRNIRSCHFSGHSSFLKAPGSLHPRISSLAFCGHASNIKFSLKDVEEV